ncbi:hypothetical protein ILUMI_20428, partial [Ignelater luminosus]
TTFPPGMTILTFSTLYWVSAVTISVVSILFRWNRLVYPRFKEGRSIWNVIKTYKVNYFSVNPHQVLDMCKNGKPSDADTSSLVVVALAGAPLTEEQILHIRRCFDFPNALVMNTYGQTETSVNTLGFNPARDPNDMKFLTDKPLSVGRPMPGFTYK